MVPGRRLLPEDVVEMLGDDVLGELVPPVPDTGRIGCAKSRARAKIELPVAPIEKDPSESRIALQETSAIPFAT